MSAAQDNVQAPATRTTIGALKPATEPEANIPEVVVGFTSMKGFALVQRVATMFSQSSIVPQRFQNNVANCAIALEMAQRMGASPLMIMQNLYVVYGNPGWAAKFLIATFNQCGRFSSIKYRFQGTRGKDDWGCIATTTEYATGEKIEGPLITIDLAKKEGWYDRKDSKWKTIPEQMLRYRSAAWMINTTAPEISMGLRTEDELHDTFDASRGLDGSFSVTSEALQQAEATTAGNDATPVQSESTARLPDAVSFDKESALHALNEAGDINTLNHAWDAIINDYDTSKRPLPVEVEIKFKDRKAGFEEAAAKQ